MGHFKLNEANKNNTTKNSSFVYCSDYNAGNIRLQRLWFYVNHFILQDKYHTFSKALLPDCSFMMIILQ